MHAIKGWAAREVNKLMGERGSIWQQSFYDRIIRDERHLAETIAYIHRNPVLERLAEEPQGYRFSSAFPGAKTDIEAFFGG